MPKGNYGPKTDADVSPFMNKFNSELTAALCATLGVSTGVGSRKEQLAFDTLNADYIFGVLNQIAGERKQVTSIKDVVIYGKENQTVSAIEVTVPPAPPATLKSGILHRTFALASFIKESPNYTEAIGKLLGIVGPEIVIDESTMQPAGKVTENTDTKIVIDIVKGHADAIAVYCHVVADDELPLLPGMDEMFKFYGIFSHPPYVDHHLNRVRKPETRRFKFYYIKNDKIIGVASDIVEVTAAVYIAPDGSELSGQVKENLT